MQTGEKNNPLDYSAVLMIFGCNVRYWEADFSDDRGREQLPESSELFTSMKMYDFRWQAVS
jgi:hypothetical protein